MSVHTYNVSGHNHTTDKHADYATVRCSWGEALQLAGYLLEQYEWLETVRLSRPGTGAGFYLCRDLVTEVPV